MELRWRFLVAGGALVVVASAATLGARRRVLPFPPAPVGVKRETLERGLFDVGLDSLVGSLDTLDAALGAGSVPDAQRAFRAARGRYKRVEGLVWFYAPQVAGLLDGPLPEGDGDSPPPPLGAPAGFQIVEAGLFAAGDSGARDGKVGGKASGKAAIRGIRERLAGLRGGVEEMRREVATLRTRTSLLGVARGDVLDADRLELARISTLWLMGVDSDASGDEVVESAEALEGMAGFADLSSSEVGVAGGLRAAAGFLRENSDPMRLDRLAFIVRFAEPAAQSVAAARAAVGPIDRVHRRVWRPDAATVFDSNALDASALAPDYAPVPTSGLVALGARLFADPVLSGPKTRSCATCHDPSRAFTDGLARAATLAGHFGPARNTPTLINAGLAPRLFDDARAGSLEEQAGVVLASPSEMGSSATLVATRLGRDSTYETAFRAAGLARARGAISEMDVRIAIAAYVRSLTGLRSRFDRAARGDTAALTAAERRGFTVFAGKGRCGSCHFAPLFGGSSAPDFGTSSLEIIGVPRAPTDLRVDPDSGGAGVDHIDGHTFAFRVPSLRNVAVTAPYMHNGAFATLADVVEFYNRGGGAGEGVRLPVEPTLSPRPLRLTVRERADLVAFLGALTDTSVVKRNESREKAPNGGR